MRTISVEFKRLEELLCNLAVLMAEGHSETIEADKLRDGLDVIFPKLSPIEVAWYRELSADLYLIEDGEVPCAPYLPVDEYQLHLREAVEQNEWEDVLVLLRHRPANLFSLAQVGYYRARAYEHLGHGIAAIAFWRFCVQQDPLRVVYCYSLLTALESFGAAGEAEALANQYLADSNSATQLVIGSCSILYKRALSEEVEVAALYHERIIDALNRTFEGAADAEVPLPVYALGLLTLGFSCSEVGRLDEAAAAFDRALIIEPESVPARVARGMFRALRHPDTAVDDLILLADQHVQVALPYVVLCYYYLGKGDFVKAIKYANWVRSRTASNSLIAASLNWRAIAEYELGNSVNNVETLLLEASTLSPANDAIRHNLTELIRSPHAHAFGNSSTSKIDWDFDERQQRDELWLETRFFDMAA